MINEVKTMCNKHRVVTGVTLIVACLIVFMALYFGSKDPVVGTWVANDSDGVYSLTFYNDNTLYVKLTSSDGVQTYKWVWQNTELKDVYQIGGPIKYVYVAIYGDAMYLDDIYDIPFYKE